MKHLSTVVLLSSSLVACVADGPSEETTSTSSLTSNMPAAAAKAMKDAESINMTPLFFACPRYLTFEPKGMDDNGSYVTGWFGPEAAIYDANKPTFSSIGSTFQVLCGTNQNSDPLMSVRKNLPSGYTTCTTSTVGTTPAWFVCT